ncbi:MAG TPA: alpha-L-fucosidase [Gemmatimonadaceae bacterium]|nr:alpha-L-fucosidase [Gemmatimonadaceae bacterium]
MAPPTVMGRLSRVLIALLVATGAGAQSPPPVRIDWPAFLGRHDLVWPRPPSSWGESAFIGNGDLGATVFQRNGKLSWQINRTRLVHAQSRYPVGRVTLETRGAQRSGSTRLTLWNAEATGEVLTDSGAVRWRSYVSRTPSVIVIELRGTGGERRPELGWEPAEARPPRKVARSEAFVPEDLHPAAVVSRTAREIGSLQSFIGGGAHAEVIRRGPTTPSGQIFFVSIGIGASAGAARQDAAQEVERAATAGETRLSSSHRAWWHRYYPASFLSFPDARLESYYWIQIYKLGSAMRDDGPILDLNGPWYSDTPWPAIWWNLNAQLTYSPLFHANRLELSESLFRNLDRNRQALIENVPERLRGEAAAIGRSSGPDLVRKVDLATATSDAAHEMGNLPWTMFYYWQYYRATMDERLLRERVYPLLARAIGNYLAYVEKGADGRYHLPKTHSPELATMPDANYDLALLRWGLQTLVTSAERLALDDPRLPRWRDVLANLTPFPTDSSGLLVGRGRPWKESHRHYSHLLAIYPLALLRPDRPGERALIERSLATWESTPELFRGYSYTGGGAMHAMLGDGDAALVRMNKYLDAPRYMEANTFYAEAGPVIETPLAAANTLQDLFVQDWGDAIRLFPAVPAIWRDASFHRLRTERAFLVSGVRRGGRTVWVRVESLAGQPCRLVVSDWTRTPMVRARSGAEVRIRGASDGQLDLDIPKGGWVVLAVDASAPMPALTPVTLDSSQHHRWPALTPRTAPPSSRASSGPQDRPDMDWWRRSMQTRDARLAWWREARFGMFIHWGVYSRLAGSWQGSPVRGYAEHIQRIRKVPAAQYRAEAVERFDPVKFDADAWIRAAKQAGMGYMVVTAKHHDGFALFDSRASDYNVVKATPWRRDPMRELRDAAKRQGLRFGFYYSHAFDWGDAEAPGNDWEFQNPGGDLNLHGGRDWWLASPERVATARRYVDRKAIPQIRELIAQYDPDILWFDTPHKLPPEENLRILRAAREAKPGIVINGRGVQPVPDGPEARFGDYANTADRPAEIYRHAGDWEAIPTTNESYGYHASDSSHKPPEHFVRLLAKAAARGGNLLLNIGPRGDGSFDAKDAAILEGIGRWMAVNGESIRGTTRTPLPPQLWGQSTLKGNRIYLHVFDWPSNGKLHLSGLRSPVFAARLLARPDSPPLTVTRMGPADVEITVPATPVDPWDTVVVLDCGVPMETADGIWIPAAGPPATLHVFDAAIAGAGIAYGDGKRGNDVTQRWSDTASIVSWTVRVTEPARYRVALEYAQPSADSLGAFELIVAGARFAGTVRSTAGNSAFAAHDLGTVTLQPGATTIAVRPTRIPGTSLMRLRSLILTPASTAAP